MNPEELDAALEKHGARVKEIADEIKGLVGSESAEAKARIDELNAQTNQLMEDVKPLLDEKRKADEKATLDATTARLGELEQMFTGLRASSKARIIGNPSLAAHKPYVPGAFITALRQMGDPREMPDTRVQAKATLEQLSNYEDPAVLYGRAYGGSKTVVGDIAGGKATLATTDATGGWIVPNALVEEIVKPAVQANPYRGLVTLREGVTAFQIDQPWRGAAPARMTIASRGATKENVDLTYNGYTVTMYTLARIHDVANQFLKQSAGAAERDVLEELASAATLGEQYYIIEGAGSTEPYGLQTALDNAPGGYGNEGTFTAAATLAGSIAAAVSVQAGALADRSVTTGLSTVVRATTWWLAMRQGADAAGFYIPRDFDNSDPYTNPVRIWGIPFLPDANITQTDDLITGRFKSLKVYIGDAFRIDSSSIAGNRWDENETGFRGEFEMGLDARAAVYTGNFTRLQDVVP